MRKGGLWSSGGSLILACVLAACGGDAQLGGGDPGNGGGGDDDNALNVSNVVLLSSSSQLPSNAISDDDGIEITAIARNASNNVVPGVELDFSADSGALNVLDPVTTAGGRATAILTTGGDARNRTITVSAGQDGAAQAELTIDVVGTRLEVSGPQSIRPGAEEAFELRLIDAGGNGLRDVAIMATSENGNPVEPATAVTDAGGNATVIVTASAAGEDTLTFDAFDGLETSASFLTSRYQIEFLEPTADREVAFGTPVDVAVAISEQGSPSGGEQVTFSATRGDLSALSGVTDADGRANVTLSAQSSDGAGPVLISARGPDSVLRTRQIELVSNAPSAITVQAEPGTLAADETSVVTARVTDPDGNPVKNQEVRFSLQDTSAGGLTASTAITDIQGVARTTYEPGAGGSSTDGVVVTARIGVPEIARDSTELTVRAAPLFIVLGSDNEISDNGEDATYSKVYNALITDAAGNPPPEDTEFRLTLRSLEYQKGFYVRGAERWEQVLNVAPSDPFFGTPNPDPASTFGPYFGGGPFGCRSEDPLGSGDINRSDDYNGNGVIDPPAVAIAPNTAEIDENGVASFELRWAQSVASWVLVRLTVIARVDGTESRRSIDFTLPVAAPDVNDLDATPPNQISPFGTASNCVDPA